MVALSRVILVHRALGLKPRGFSMTDAALKRRSPTVAPDLMVAPDLTGAPDLTVAPDATVTPYAQSLLAT